MGTKYLVTADVHIYPFSSFSTYDQYGIPSRLTLYLELATRLVEIGRQNRCSWCIISGDFLNTSINRPMTLNIANKFLRIVNSVMNVLIIPGQHDLDNKSTYHQVHSAISALELYSSQNKIVYTHSAMVDLDGYPAYVRGWDQNGITIEQDNKSRTEIFIGHGTIQGARIYDGFQFKDGITVDNLMRRYRLSIIGDIHNGQTWYEPTMYGDPRLVLIPGSPIQNSFKDSPNCGVWTVEYPELKTQFIPIDGDPFHKFIHAKDEEEYFRLYLQHGKSNLVHIRKPDLHKPPKYSTTTSSKLSTNNLIEIASQELALLKTKFPEVTLNILQDLLSKSHHEPKNIPNIELLSIKIFGFGNIDELDLDFSSIPSPLLITGPNGSGKSTLVEAIFWCLTGETAKGVPVNDVPNRESRDGCYVRLEISVNNDIFTIFRSRNHISYGTDISIKKHGDNNEEFKRSSKAETQNLLSEITGLSSTLILNSCYLTARCLNVFGDLSNTDKYNMLAILADLSVLDNPRKTASEELSNTKNKLIELQTTVRNLNNEISNLQDIDSKRIKYDDINKKFYDMYGDELNSISQQLETQLPNDVFINCVNSLYSLSETKLSKLTPLSVLNEQLQVIENRAKDLNLKIKDDTSKNTLAKDKLNDLLSTIETVKEKKICTLCKQPVSESIVSSIENQTRLDELKQTIEECTVSITKNQDLLSTVNTEILTLKEKINISNNYSNILKTLTNIKKSFYNTMNLTESNKQLPELIESKQSQRAKLNSEINTFEQRVECLTVIVKELLSNNGKVVQRLIADVCKDFSNELAELLPSEKLQAVIEIQHGAPRIIAKVNGKNRNYTDLSSGQKQIIDSAILVGMNNLVSKKFNQTKGLLGSVFLDEVFSYLDTEYIEIAYNILSKSVAGRLWVITHDQNLQNYFTNILAVSNNNGIARYKLQY